MDALLKQPQIGDVQIGNAADYDDIGTGFVIEEFGGDYWAIPDWTERSLPHLEGVFLTMESAQAALVSA